MTQTYGDLVPAYTDYKTAKEARDAWLSGKDWRITSMFHPNSGMVLNIEDARNDGCKSVILRYCRLTKVVVVKF